MRLVRLPVAHVVETVHAAGNAAECEENIGHRLYGRHRHGGRGEEQRGEYERVLHPLARPQQQKRADRRVGATPRGGRLPGFATGHGTVLTLGCGTACGRPSGPPGRGTMVTYVTLPKTQSRRAENGKNLSLPRRSVLLVCNNIRHKKDEVWAPHSTCASAASAQAHASCRSTMRRMVRRPEGRRRARRARPHGRFSSDKVQFSPDRIRP